jgi:hypothetical protein
MAEFGVRTVILAPPAGAPAIVPLAELLPHPFGGPDGPRRAAPVFAGRSGRRRRSRAGL